MKTLILGTSYIAAGTEGAQNYGARMVRLWAGLAAKLNPDCDILIVDSASPVDFRSILPNFNTVTMLDADGHASSSLIGIGRRTVGFLPDNVGHINVTGKDGWGRAFCAGVEVATKCGYDYIAYTDVDIILTRPVRPIIEKMARAGVKACCPLDTSYGFLENGLMFLNVAYLRDSGFIERYDWPSRTNDGDPLNIPEMVFERLMEDDIFILPLRGLRDDQNALTVNNLPFRFPYGVDYLTHVRDFVVYEKLLEMKGIVL